MDKESGFSNIILAPFGSNPYSDTSLDTESLAFFGSATWAATSKRSARVGVFRAKASS